MRLLAPLVRGFTKRDLPMAIFFLLYLGGYLAYEASNYSSFNVPYGNLGFVAQEAIAAFHLSGVFSGGNIPFWATDGSFLFLPVSPFAVAFGIVSLFVFSPILMISTAYLLYSYCLRRLAYWEAFLIAASFLLSPLIAGQAAWGFDSIMIGMFLWTLLLVLLDAAGTSRPWLIVGVIVLALLSKNESALLGVGVGLWLLLFSDHKRLGAVIIAASLVWIQVLEGVLIPLVDHGSDPILRGLWGYMGKTMLSKVTFILSNPVLIFHRIGAELPYLYRVLAPMVPFVILSPLGLIVAGPSLLSNVLSRSPVSTDIYDEFSYFVLPFVYLSAASGLSLLHSVRTRRPHMEPKTLAVGYLGLLLLVSTYPSYKFLRHWSSNDAPPQTAHALVTAMASVPETALFVTPDLYGGMAYRFKYVQNTENGLGALQSSINEYGAHFHLERVQFYYLGYAGLSDNPSIVQYLIALRTCSTTFAQHGVYLERCAAPVPQVTAPVLSSMGQFSILYSAVRSYYQRVPHGSNQIYPAQLEAAGYLSRLFGGAPRTSVTWNATNTGGWIGPWFSRDVGIGVTASPSEVLRIWSTYKKQIVSVLFPYPNKWLPGRPRGSASRSPTGLAMFVFARRGF